MNWLLVSWDFAVYSILWRSLNRMFIRNPGMAYLFELHLRDYRLNNPLPKKLERQTEQYFQEIRERKKAEGKK